MISFFHSRAAPTQSMLVIAIVSSNRVPQDCEGKKKRSVPTDVACIVCLFRNFICFRLLLQSTRFTHERSTSNIHRLVHSSISFFEKFSDSANLGFYIRNINFVVRNFSWNIVIIIRTFRPGTQKLVSIP